MEGKEENQVTNKVTSFGQKAVYLDTADSDSINLKTKIASLIDEIELFRNKQNDQYKMIQCNRAMNDLIEIDSNLFKKRLNS